MSMHRRICGAVMGLAVAASGLSVGPAARAQSSADCSESSSPDQMDVKVISPSGSEPRTNPAVPIEVEVTNTWSRVLPTQPEPAITKITVRLLRCREGQVLPDEIERATTGSSKTLRLKWDDPAPVIPTNGPFAVEVIANGNRPGSPAQQSRKVVPFSLAVPPKRPAGVTSQAEGGTVTVSWSLRDQELDLVLYEVERAAQGSGDFTTVSDGVVDASVASVKDTPGTGAWRYRVVAIRRGAGESDGIKSIPSAVATAEIAAPTTTGGSSGSGSGTTATTAGSGSTGTTGGSTATASRSGTGGASTVNLSTYSGALAARRQTNGAGERDSGFSETLPFTPRPAGSEDELGSEDEGEPMELGADEPNQGEGQRLISDEGDRRRSLGFVAFGLLLFVLSMTGLFLKSEVKRADELDPLDPLPPDGGPSVRPPAPSPSPAPAAAPSPPPWSSPAVMQEPAPLEARPWALGAPAVAAHSQRPEPEAEPQPTPEPQPRPAPQATPEPEPEPERRVEPQSQVLAPPPVLARPPERRARRRPRTAPPSLVPPAPPTDPAGFATDLSVVGFDDLSEPAAATAPVRRRHRTVAPSDAPSLDIPDPVPAPPVSRTTRTRTPPNARRTSPRLPPRPADDRREGGPTVRPRRRRTGEGNRRLPVG